LQGYIDLETLEIDAALYVKFPIFPPIKLTEVKGNLTDGVTVSFSLLGKIEGSARFYIKDNYLRMHLKATIFGKVYEGDYRLIPIPQ
jgi:hypothetical protein